MTSLKKYLFKYQYPDLVFDYINLCCAVDSGIPEFLVSPVGGSKSTLIQAIAQKYNKGAYVVKRLERVSPLRMISIQDDINDNEVLFVSEDFSTIGQDSDSTYKTVLMVSKLSYDKTYVDTLFRTKEHPEGLNLRVRKLAFLCGMQPLWLALYTGKEVFQTIISEKILRYYRLPIYPIQTLTKMEYLINYLNALDFSKIHSDYYPKAYFVRKLQDALMIQCGNRAR